MIQLKNPDQIKIMKEAGRITGEALLVARDHVRPGISTYELDRYVREHIEKAGAKPSFLGYGGFPASACISINDEVIHGIPSKNRKIKEGDIVSLDGGIVLDGFFSDCAKTIPIGKVSKEAENLMEITKRALDAGIDACKFGSRIHDISRAVSGVINKKYGIVTEYCGHGVGLAVHEDPNVPNDLVGGPNPRLQEGMVLAIEPMINLGTGDVELLDDEWTVVTADGKLSSHQEHTVVIFRDHTEILTII